MSTAYRTFCIVCPKYQVRRTARKLKPRSQSFGKFAVFVRVRKPFVVVGYEAVQRDGIFREKSSQRQDEEKGMDVQLSC